jgi:ubiquinone/menaquinone biosynthesis C-methylase UbiE
MSRTVPFNTHHRRYEEWFTHHQVAYHSELLAIRTQVPWQGIGLEIGLGTGRFAAPLGVEVGVDPSREMLTYALERGISCVQGIAEALPFKDAIFDYALVVTTICFVDDPKATLTEARRVLKPGAPFVIGFIDRTSTLGQHYFVHQAENVFYREATFYTASEVGKLLTDAGFFNQTWGQVLLKPLNEIQEIEPIRTGRGQGAFVVVRASRS